MLKVRCLDTLIKITAFTVIAKVTAHLSTWSVHQVYFPGAGVKYRGQLIGWVTLEKAVSNESLC